MKTSIYNKEKHIEGYVGSGKTEEKSEVQKEYEKGNEGNEVTSFGKVPLSENNLNENIKNGPRDGFDNTGTQGKDSLSDDSYNSADKNPTIKSAESHTGSSSKDFETKNTTQRDEDDVLNTGI